MNLNSDLNSQFKVTAAKVTSHYTFKTVLFSFSKQFYMRTGAAGNKEYLLERTCDYKVVQQQGSKNWFCYCK